jgi:hypothetical protein
MSVDCYMLIMKFTTGRKVENAQSEPDNKNEPN